MSGFRFSSYAWLTAGVVLVATGVLAYLGWQHADTLRTDARETVEQSRSLVGADIAEGIVRTDELLTVLAASADVRDPDPVRCDAFLSGLMGRFAQYATLGVVTPDGRVRCSGHPRDGEVRVEDRPHFHRIISTRDPATSGYLIDRISGRPSLVSGHPILDGDGGLTGVVYASVDLDWLHGRLREGGLPGGSVAGLADRNGIVLAREPDNDRWQGRHLPDLQVTRLIRAVEQPESHIVAGVDGVTRMYSFEPLDINGERVGAVWVGYPLTRAYAEANRFLLVALLTVIMIAGISLAGAKALAVKEEQRIRSVLREREQLEAVNQMKDAFIESVSHELRTPLTSVLGFTKTLMREDLPDDTRKDLTARAASNAERLEHLITNLLDVDALTRGTSPVSLRPVRLDTLVAQVAGRLLDDRRLKLETEPLEASIDPAHAERIVGHLARNIVAHVPPDARVWVRLRREAGNAVLVFEDEGPGVPAELREQLLLPFERHGTQAHSPGLGVGLTVVSRLARVYRGTISIRARRGGGTSVTVVLQVDARPPQDGSSE